MLTLYCNLHLKTLQIFSWRRDFGAQASVHVANATVQCSPLTAYCWQCGYCVYCIVSDSWCIMVAHLVSVYNQWCVVHYSGAWMLMITLCGVPALCVAITWDRASQTYCVSRLMSVINEHSVHTQSITMAHLSGCSVLGLVSHRCM